MVRNVVESIGGRKELRRQLGMRPKDLMRLYSRKDRIRIAGARAAPGRTSVRPAEVLEYYRKNAAEFVYRDGLKLRVITFLKTEVDAATAETVPRSGAKELAETVLAVAKAAPDRFEELARKHSDDKRTAERGGLMGSRRNEFVALEDLVEDLCAPALKLAVGGVSGLIESKVGYHVLKLEGKRAAGPVPFARVRAAIEKKLQSRLRAKAHRKWLEHLVSRAYVVDENDRPIPKEVLETVLKEVEDEG